MIKKKKKQRQVDSEWAKENTILTEKQCEILVTDIFIPKNKFRECTLTHLLKNKDLPDYIVDT